jgi:hypothetical protein
VTLPRSAAGWTIAVFGVLAMALGTVGLIRPEATLALVGFEVLDPAARAAGDHTRTFVVSSSMAAFNMGVYYLVAAASEWRLFYRFTVYFRVLTFIIFTTLVINDAAPGRFLGVALWELFGAVATAIALGHDRRRPVTQRGNPVTVPVNPATIR